MGLNLAVEASQYDDLDTGLRVHLFHNHYPPLPNETVEISKQAIELANRGEWDTRIDTNPEGLPFDEAPVGHRKWGCHIPVRVIIEGWHLQPWVDFHDDYDEAWEGGR